MLRKTPCFFIFAICLFLRANCETKAYNYETLAMQVQKNTAQELAVTFNLRPIGFVGFGGSMMDHIKRMAIMFECDRDLSIEEGTELLKKSTQIFIQNVNRSESIRPYLVQYPANIENVEIIIYPNKGHFNTDNEAIRSLSYYKGEMYFISGKELTKKTALMHK